MTITKQKILEMFIVALLSALIAFMQNVLGELVSNDQIQNSPELAGVIGGAISGIRNFKYV